MQRGTSVLLVAAALLVASAGLPAGVADQAMSDEAFEERLTELQERSRDALDHYEAGDAEAALEEARRVEQAFAFEQGNTSTLERKIKQASAVAIGEQVKAQASRLASAIEAGEPVDEVRTLQEELEPKLNRLVLVSQGKHAPASQRELKSDEAIDAAADEVTSLVDEAVALYEDGQADQAQRVAEDAFFVFESNGLGPDSSVVDEGLENDVENDIKNFQGDAGEPGLADLIAEGANVTQVRSQAETIDAGIDQIVELLKATKPPTDVGDANSDGDVTIVDALLTAQASLGIRTDEPTMDANQDGSVSIVDALLIAQASLGIRTL